MKKILLIALASISSFALAFEVGHIKDEYSPCSAIDDDGIVDPFNGTICADDLSLNFMYKYAPRTTRGLIEFFGESELTRLDEHHEIIKKFDSTPLTRKNLVNEDTAYLIAKYIRYLACLFFTIQLVWIIVCKAKGESTSDHGWFHSGNLWRLLFGAFLFIPITDYSFLCEYLIIICALLGFSAFPNVVISTYAYGTQIVDDSFLAANNTINNPVYTPNNAISSRYANALIDGALCATQTAIAKIGEDSQKDLTSALYHANFSGVRPAISINGDSSNSLVEVTDTANATLLTLGLYGDTTSPSTQLNRSLPCSIISVPKHRVDYADTISEKISFAVQNSVKAAANSGEIAANWHIAERRITDMMLKLGFPAKAINQQVQLAMYDYHNQLQTNLFAGSQEQGDKQDKQLKKQVGLAFEIADQLRQNACYTDIEAPFLTQKTLKAVKDGNWRFEGNLNCARLVTDSNGVSFEEMIDAGDIRKEAYKTAILEALNKNLDDLNDNYNELLGSITAPLAKITASYHTASMNINQQKEPLAVKMRKEGFFNFGLWFQPLEVQSEQSNTLKTAYSQFRPKITRSIDPKTWISGDLVTGQSLFLNNANIKKPDYMDELNRDFGGSDPFFTNQHTENVNDIAVIASRAIESAPKLIHGGDIDAEAFIDDAKTAITNTVTRMVARLSAAVGADIIVASVGSAWRENGFSGVADVDPSTMYKKFELDCENNNTELFNEALKQRCQFRNRHPLLSFSQFGADLKSSGLTLLLFGTIFTVAADLTADASTALSALKGVDDLASVSDKGIKGKAKSAAKNFNNKAISFLQSSATMTMFALKAMAGTMISVGVLAAITGLLLEHLGLIAYISFLIAVFASIMQFAQLFISSGLLPLSMTVFRKKWEVSAASEKSFFPLLLNLLLRPTYIVTSFIICWLMIDIAIKLWQEISFSLMADTLRYYSDSFVFSPAALLGVIIMSVVNIMYTFYLIKTMFSFINQIPNELLASLGIDAINAAGDLLDNANEKTTAIYLAVEKYNKRANSAIAKNLYKRRKTTTETKPEGLESGSEGLQREVQEPDSGLSPDDMEAITTPTTTQGTESNDITAPVEPEAITPEPESEPMGIDTQHAVSKLLVSADFDKEEAKNIAQQLKDESANPDFELYTRIDEELNKIGVSADEVINNINTKHNKKFTNIKEIIDSQIKPSTDEIKLSKTDEKQISEMKEKLS